ncbi:hypothetical protein PN36_03040 [Candidatus Thiomargarita nelsonii]|uniref:Caspase family p20 domain-containing protein n=1 Tax=Candidatus Thiomargarita nelsonii TaxID=1003181 RepID=A0A0A6RZ39_9GAMM|nr:hypothetical protein PN36_03040 [Candidatus Thiomargarita nelsonii]
MHYYLIILLSLSFLITGCSQQYNTRPKGSGTQPTTSPASDNGTRLALLIGNGNYNKNANRLKLGALDNQALSQGGCVGLFYISGHGFQYENINYLMFPNSV